MTFQQILSAPELGQKVIGLTLSQDTPAPLQGAPVIILCDYDDALPHGVVLPLSIQVTSPDGRLVVDRIVTRVVPQSFDFIPDMGGTHLARVAELNHNRFVGTLQVTVVGDESSQSSTQ